MKLRLLITIFCVMVGTTSLFSDQIILKNGNTLPEEIILSKETTVEYNKNEMKNNELNIKFSNKIFIEHFSGILYNDMRSEHKTLFNKPSINLNEKFQIYLQFAGDDETNSTQDCFCLPTSSSSTYISANFVYIHDENFAARTGGEIEFGSGDYKNPFLSFGFGLTNFNDMVFNYSQSYYPTFFFNIGYKDNMHIFFDAAGNHITFGDANLDYRDYDNIDIALGYKKAVPLFLRFNLLATQTADFNIAKEEQLIYEHETSFMHLQYYGDYYGLSAGYIYNKEKYKYTHFVPHPIGEASQTNTIVIGNKKSQGGGLTFYKKNSDSSIELSGEFHLLADSHMNWMTISKFGVKVYF